MTKAKIRVSNVLFNILVIITAVAVIFVCINLIAGAKGYSVVSGSMEETLSRGDIVFSRRVQFEELKEGDIITVSVGNSGYFTHRIVAIDSESKTVTTRGDANPSDDPMDTKSENIVGRMWYSVPLLGYFSIAFSGLSTTVGLMIFAVVAIALIAINMILARKNGKYKNKVELDTDKEKNEEKMRGDNDEQV